MSFYENNYDDQLKQLIQNNTRFVSLMGHEIRTYMNAIIGFANILENEPISELQKEFVGSILENGNGLMSLTDKIVEYTRIQSMDKAGIIKSSVDLNSLIAKIDTTWSKLMKDKGLTFKIHRSSSAPDKFISCQDHLVRCIDLLLENSYKYTDSGSVTLKLSSKEEPEYGAFLMIDIEDTGCGISSNLQHTAFEPFERGEHDEMTSGMGLAILASLVELHNGAVYFDSSPDEGSDFSICMPIIIKKQDSSANAMEDTAFAHNAIPYHSEQSTVLKGKILVADDNFSSRKLMAVLLKSIGCECEFAKNGQTVLDTYDQNFDIILMDIRMPDMSGLEVTKTLRNKGFKKPIIAVTAFAMPYNQQECIDAGCNGYISKPLSREILINVLKENLS